MKHTFRHLVSLLQSLVIMIIMTTNLQAQVSSNITYLSNWGAGDGQNFAVFALGNLTYYGVGNKLKIVDYTTPTAPQELSSLTFDALIEEVVRVGDYAYLVAGNKLHVIYTLNPTAPSVVGSLEFAKTTQSLATKQNLAFIGGGDGGLIIVDISSPANPTQIAQVDTIGYTEGVAVSGDYVFATTGGDLVIFNIATPSTPVWEFSFPVAGWTQNISISGSFAYLSDYDNGIYVLNISNPASPVQVGYASTGYRTTKVVFDGDYAFVSNGDSMRVLNISTPSSPQIITGVAMQDRAVNISIGIQKAFVADRNFGLHCIDISNPSNPTIIHQAPIVPPATGSAYNVFYTDNKAYVSYGTSGLRIIDVSNLNSPVLLGEIDTPNDARGTVVKDGYAYVADRDSGVRVINATDASNPVEISTIGTPRARGIAINGNYAYVAASDSGMAILDLTDPSAPVWVKSATDFYGEAVAVNGNLAAVSRWDAIKIYDMPAPTNPIERNKIITLSTGSAGFCLVGNYLYISDFDTMRIYDISSVNQPAQLSAVYKGGEWDGTVEVEGNYAYTVSEGEGIKIFNIMDKVNPIEVGYYDGINSSRGIAVNNGIIYVAERTAGLSIYKNDLITGVDNNREFSVNDFMLYQNYPNPFNPTTTITFELLEESLVKLVVVNTLGQIVATLADEYRSAGSHNIIFDASHLSSGVYFYKLSADDFTSTKKMILLK